MSERLRIFSKYLSEGGLYPCNIFTSLVFEFPEQVLASIQNVDSSVSLRDRVLCNCFAQTEIDCDCLPMPLLNHFVYIISSFSKPFQLAQQIIDVLIEKGCDVNKIDADIGTVLHSVICCIDNDNQMNVSRSESELSLRCLEYLLSLNLCDINFDIGYDNSSKARGTPLSMAVERELITVVKKLIIFGVCVTKTSTNRWIIPKVLNENYIQIFDLLFEAGLPFDSNLHTEDSPDLTTNNIQIKYKDWIRNKKCVPMNLKSLARIVLRDAFKKKFNDKNLVFVPISLKVFLNFEEIICN